MGDLTGLHEEVVLRAPMDPTATITSETGAALLEAEAAGAAAEVVVVVVVVAAVVVVSSDSPHRDRLQNHLVKCLTEWISLLKVVIVSSYFC